MAPNESLNDEELVVAYLRHFATGRTVEASAQIEVARGEAFAERDAGALKQLEELSASCAGRE
jgi:hypothetical protein